MLRKKKKKQGQPAQERPGLTIAFCTLVLVALIINYHWSDSKMDHTSAGIGKASLQKAAIEDTTTATTLVDNNPIPMEEITGLAGTLPYLRPIPNPKDGIGGMSNFRSGQLMPYESRQLYDLGIINTVIRLNGKGIDSGGVSKEQERELCEAYGIQFVEINLSKTKDAAQIIHQYLMEGGVHLHCLHGFDRTGGMVAFHLRQSGYSKEEAIDHNNWGNYLKTKGKAYYWYYKYVEE